MVMEPSLVTVGMCKIGPHETLSIACALRIIMPVYTSVQDPNGGLPASPPAPATRHGLESLNVGFRVKHHDQLHELGGTATAEVAAGMPQSVATTPLSLQLPVDPLKLRPPQTDDDVNSMSASPTQSNRAGIQAGRQAPTSAESRQNGTRTLSSGAASMLIEDATANTNSGASQRGGTAEMPTAVALEGEPLTGEPQNPLEDQKQNGACKGALWVMTCNLGFDVMQLLK